MCSSSGGHGSSATHKHIAFSGQLTHQPLQKCHITFLLLLLFFFSLLLEYVVFLAGMFSFVQYDCSAFTNILAFISADSPAVILQW